MWLRFTEYTECSLCHRYIPPGECFLGNSHDFFAVCNQCRTDFRCNQCHAVIQNEETVYSNGQHHYCQRCSADFAPADEMHNFQFPYVAKP